MNPEWIGFMAGCMTTIAFLPQAVQVLRTKSTRDISLGMYIVFCIGNMLWVSYGLFMETLAIIFSSSITLVLAGTILIIKLLNMRRE